MLLAPPRKRNEMALPIASRRACQSICSLSLHFSFFRFVHFLPREKLSFFLLSVTQSRVVEKLKAVSEGRLKEGKKESQDSP